MSQSPAIEVKAWIAHLRALAQPVADLREPPRVKDVALPLWLSVAEVVDLPMPPREAELRPEVGLWWLVARGSAGKPITLPDDVLLKGGGPLLPREPYRAIEVWTDAELSAMHALSILARRDRQKAWEERLAVAAHWHLEHTQPDNATNRPWALHLFLSLCGGEAEAVLYAETLLHNALAHGGAPEPISALIMLSSAAELELRSAVSLDNAAQGPADG